MNPGASISLRTRAALLVVVAALVAISAVVVVSYRSMRAAMLTQHANAAQSVARSLAAIAEVPLIAGDRRELRRLIDLKLRLNELASARVLDANGVEVEGSADGPPGSFTPGAADIRTTPAGTLDVFGDHAPGDAAATEVIGRVEVALPDAPLHAELAFRRRAFVGIAIITVAAIGAIAWVMAGGWTRRLQALIDAAERIARGELGVSIGPSAHDEIGRLGDSLERMRAAVHERDASLRRFNDRLQEQVLARTADLEHAMLDAQSANRAKSEFLANMSHEIRTPMTAILGFADLLSDDGLPPADRRDCIETIHRSGRHLLEVINDILDLSKIEAGRMTVERIACSPAAIIEDVRALMDAHAAQKGLALRVEIDPPLPACVATDPTRLRQILLNLVGNAVKFTHAGGVVIRASYDGAVLTVEVRDTGIGIAPEQLGELFSPFSQSDSTMSRRYGGTGLGLALSRRFAQLLGGEVRVESTPGVGSTFTLEIPTPPADAAPSAAPTERTPARADLANTRILLAEDGPDNQRLITHQLRRAGATVTIVADGRAAVDAVRAAPQNFDLVLMDMQMPELDGYAAAAALRAAGVKTPVVALTAHALSGDRDRCLAAGCDDYLAKPVSAEQLLNVCRRLAPAARAA